MTEKEEFCENIRLCENSMYALAYSVLKNDSDSGEVISESIYRAYKNLGKLKNKRLFKPWILRIVHNTAVEMIRKNSGVIHMEEIEQTSEENSDGDIEERLILREAVENLRQPYRTVVLLFYYENLSVSKIADITDSNVSAVKKQLSRARQMLRESLKGGF